MFIDIDKADGPPITSQGLLDGAQETCRAFKSRRGPRIKWFVQKFVHVAEQLQRYSKAIDVLCQVQPNVSTIVWGTVRTILEVSGPYYPSCHPRSRGEPNR